MCVYSEWRQRYSMKIIAVYVDDLILKARSMDEIYTADEGGYF